MTAAEKLKPSLQYAFRQVGPYVRLDDAETQAVGEELARLAGNAKLSGLKAEQVVLAAKAKTSPLHAIVYQHDAKEAEHHWRCQVARQLIESIVWVPPAGDAPVRAFTMVSGAGRDGYLPTPEARKDAGVIKAKERHALKALRAWLGEFEYWAEPGSQLEATAAVVRGALEAAGE